MALTLEEWDRDVAPMLNLMSMDIASATFQIAKAKGRLMMLPARPAFDTKVEEEIERARKELRIAKQLLDDFEQRFKDKPRDE